ncbi:Fc receptor-like protein 4 isoform X2 [Sciurus carolinensis]|uniref:Fc receptor-like protein 4 isoform X2 n=1 Tax=Sciurus carolinensis TaxID=30640 RepID=UPI001FB4551C|nr:Fc receptor-like protein 4 isoform X2 [Sciurus carolinensis]
MLLWASLLILAPVHGQFAIAPKPVISLHPPWTTVFQGETVNLTCNGFHFCASEKTKWYSGHTNRKERETPGNTLQVHESGSYRCQVQGSLLSNPVILTFSTGSLILQAPYSVFEGDTLVLRCQKRGKEELTYMKYTWNGKVLISNKTLDLSIPRATLNNSGTYQCTGLRNEIVILSSNRLYIGIQELFPRPKLKVTASQPTEGNSVNLSCETQLPPERSDTPLHFIFFRDDKIILSDWSNFSELQISTIWRENSGSYRCGAETVTSSVQKFSFPQKILVQRVPVSQVSMETQPPGGQVVEGEMLVLVCSVAEGTGVTTFSWHREDTKESLGRKTQRSQRAELEIPVVRENHSGGFYCTANNSYGPIQSQVVNIIVTVTAHNRNALIAGGATGGLLSVLLLLGALLFFYWHWRRSGDGFWTAETRSPPTPDLGEPFPSICSAQMEPQISCDNVHPKEGDLVYAEIQTIQQGEEGEANTPRIPQEDKHALIVYSEVKTQLPVNSAGKISSKDEDVAEYYENILLR